MGMTCEEAISWLKKIKVKYIHGGDEDFDAKRREAIGVAIAALREQEERSKGCEFCAETLKRFDHVLAVADYYEDDIVYEPKFCPQCGRRLEEVCPEE